MRNINISKERLLTKLRENKQAHEEAFHEASEAFYKKFSQELDAIAEHVASGELNYQQAMKALQSETPPQGFCDEYEREIQMLEYEEQNTTVSITPEEFSRFVLDEWGWKQGFVAKYSSVTGKSIAIGGTQAS